MIFSLLNNWKMSSQVFFNIHRCWMIEMIIFDNVLFKIVKWTCGRTYVPKILHFRVMQADKDWKALQDCDSYNKINSLVTSIYTGQHRNHSFISLTGYKIFTSANCSQTSLLWVFIHIHCSVFLKKINRSSNYKVILDYTLNFTNTLPS